VDRIRAVIRFVEALIEGDPVALTAGAVILGIAGIACLIWWRIAVGLRREDEEWNRRRGIRKKKE
jgi:hypothetical protein